MGSYSFANSLNYTKVSGACSFLHNNQQFPSNWLSSCNFQCNIRSSSSLSLGFSGRKRSSQGLLIAAVAANGTGVSNSSTPQSGTYTVGDFMTRKEELHVVKATTNVDDALEMLVEKRVTGFPVIDDDWNLVGVVSDYDLLPLDLLSGSTEGDTNIFPDVDSSWKTFNKIQRLLIKTYGKVVGDVMTTAPLIVRETTNLEDAARLLLETKFRRLPVVDADGKLIGIITRGNVVRAALQIKRANERAS